MDKEQLELDLKFCRKTIANLFCLRAEVKITLERKDLTDIQKLEIIRQALIEEEKSRFDILDETIKEI
ncbi:MAG: hypothetical protein ACRCX2_10155 [Paraclostridium sp.]